MDNKRKMENKMENGKQGNSIQQYKKKMKKQSKGLCENKKLGFPQLLHFFIWMGIS